MAASMTETVTVQPMESMHMRLQGRQPYRVLEVRPPAGAKPKTKLRIDPQQALEPSRKKLSMLESQRIMAATTDAIRRVEIVTALPWIAENLDDFRIVFGAEIAQMMEEHRVIMQSYEELRSSVERFRRKESRAQSAGGSRISEARSRVESRPNDGEQNADGPRESSQQSGEIPVEPNEKDVRSSLASAHSSPSQSEMATRNLGLVGKRLQDSAKDILRAFSRNMTTVTTTLNEAKPQREPQADDFIEKMNRLKDFLMHMLLTTPIEDMERTQYLKEVSDKERYNAGIIAKLEAELKIAEDERDADIKAKNDVICKLQSELHQLDKYSDENIRRTKTEADKQELADKKNSEGKMTKLQQDLNQVRMQFNTLLTEHRLNEQNLRTRKFQRESEVENWIQKYDNDMGERQDEYEEIDAIYTEEKKQLNELEERFKTLEIEYVLIQEEKRKARESREAAEREIQMSIRAATIIQSFWRSFKVRKAIKAKKRKGKGGKKKGKK